MRRLPFFIIYALLALAVAGLGGYLVVAFMVEKAPEVDVPEIAGLELTEALEKLTEKELDLEVRGFSYSDEIEQNRVVRQRPSAGSVVKAGRSVGVILSRGPKKYAMPSVMGRSYEDAAIILSQAGLRAVVGAKIPGPVEGTVLAQARAPGSSMERGEEVPVVLSTGPEPKLLRMPSLQGAKLHQAEATLDSMGLAVERVEEVELGDPGRAGRVLSQEPMAGLPVEENSKVSISVAARGNPLTPGKMVLVEQYVPSGFATHEIEVIAQSVAKRRVLLRETVAGGGVLRELVSLKPGERIRIFVDGQEK